jgi:hypothetical protein
MRCLLPLLLLMTALTAAEPWLAVPPHTPTRAALPGIIRMWYHLAAEDVLPMLFELEDPVAALRGDDLVLRPALGYVAWIIKPDGHVVREEVEPFIGDWRQPSGTDLARAAAVVAGLLPASPPLRPDQLLLEESASGTALELRWETVRNHGTILYLAPGGMTGIGGWGRCGSRPIRCGCSASVVRPAASG